MTRLLVFSLLITLPLQAAPKRRASSISQFPACEAVAGTGAVTFTRDNGATLAKTTPFSGIGYTYGLLTRGTTVFAFHRNDLLISHDAGCTFSVLASYDDWDFPPSLAAGRSADRLYVWSDNRQYLVRFSDHEPIGKLEPPAAFVGFAVDANDSRRIRGGADDGAIWESRDAGDTWAVIGRLENQVGVYRIAFDPNNLEHIVAGTLGNGAFVSQNGGSTWTRAAGFAERANAFNLVISPADGNRVWAMGLDLGGGARHILQSDDGGFTYLPVVTDDDANVNLINGPVMAAHPSRRDLLYFVFGTYFQGYGTDLFRYDASTKTLTKTHGDHDDVNAIALSTVDPNVIYLGLESEEVR